MEDKTVVGAAFTGVDTVMINTIAKNAINTLFCLVFICFVVILLFYHYEPFLAMSHSGDSYSIKFIPSP